VIAMAILADFWEFVQQFIPDTTYEWMLLLLGMVAQAIFATRFITQWIASEKRKRSVVPVIFWYQSILGSLLLFLYAVVGAKDIVFTLGQSLNIPIYVRNLLLIHKLKNKQHAESETESPVCGDPHCARKNLEGSHFCAFCGRPLDAADFTKGPPWALPAPSSDAPSKH
jgi:lipid-A-disaccharide synthase-like uncharacterized protein